MNRLVDAFKLPPQALVEQRIAKKLLIEQGASTAADRRLVNEGMEDLVWVATLKPATVAVPATAEAAELALLSVTLRGGASDASARRLLQLIHRAIPYPVLLVAQGATGSLLSLADKRPSLGEAGKWVVAPPAGTHAFDPGHPSASEADFMASLALDGMSPQVLADLGALYQGYADRITALAVAQVTGRYVVPTAAAAASRWREAMREREQAQARLAAARISAGKSTQINRRVELNLQIQQLQAQLRELESRLQA